MTQEERITTIRTMIGEDVDDNTLSIYLRHANSKILNHRYPFGTKRTEIEPQFEEDLLELTIVLFNQRGAEGQKSHNENGVQRTWRTENEILEGITPMADCFL